MALPNREDPAFPDALKAAREARNLSYSDLARAIGISTVMPSRYENPKHSLFGVPSKDTWRKLNEFLTSPTSIQKSADGKASPLSAYSVDELIAEIKRRGATSVQICF
ncbi:helix-turn-helix domain-containing protein [Malikia spinosa]|uniref:helix-turn-helix domain-containing protein n=1 Tax=Malikia spinosa TaxID=86180 RepID=UPI00147505F4|nr:helix-turn-helix transcriptional regulator [Malikia spinosa]